MEDTHHKIYARVVKQQGRNWYNAVIGVEEYSELFSNMLIWPDLYAGQTDDYPGVQRNDILINKLSWKKVLNLIKHFRRESKSLSSTANPLGNSEATGLLTYPIITYVINETTVRYSETDFKSPPINAIPEKDKLVIVSLEGEGLFHEMVEIYIPRECNFKKEHISNPPQFKNPEQIKNLSTKDKGVDNTTFLNITKGPPQTAQDKDGKTIHLNAKETETDQPFLFKGGNSTVLEILDGFTRSTAIRVATLKDNDDKPLLLNEIPLVIQEPPGRWKEK